MVGKGIELATGYVTLAVETSGLAKQVSGIFRGSEGQANTAGKSMGRAMSKAFDGAKPDIDALASAVELAEKRVTAQVEQAASKQEAAKRKVEIAQAKLNEATEKFGPKSSQALTAVDRLATSEQKLESETLQAADAQSKLQAELKQSKDALSTASKASDTASKTYAKGWKGVGQRIKGHLKGGVKTATDAAEDQAERGGREAGGGFSSAFKGAIGGLAAGFSVGAIVGGIKDFSAAAGEAEQSIGAIDAVFKGNSDVMQEWAKGAKTAVGLSANEYRNLGTVLGAQLKNAGTPMEDLAGKTNGLITLGADLSSMFGGTAPEAVEAISSALKGEMDPIEKYGISLSQASLEAVAFNKGLLKATVDQEKVATASTKMELAQGKYNEAVKKSGQDSDEAKRAKLGLTAAENAFEKATSGKLPKLEGESKALAIQAALFDQSADAQGNFMREEDTYEHKRQVAIKSWDDMKEKIGNAFLPAMTTAMGYITTVGMPAIDGLATGLQGAATWIQQNSVWLGPLVAVVGGATAAWALWTGGIKLWTIATGLGAKAQGGFNAVLNANPILKIVGLILGLGAAVVWLYKNNETARKIIDAAWNGIKNGISWAWTNVIKPAFAAINWYLTNILGPVFRWLWNSIVKPLWTLISGAIEVAWGVIQTVFLAIKWAIENTLGPIFKWLWNTIIKPVWDGISKTIKGVWNDGIKPVFEALGGFIKDKVAPAFKKGVEGIEGIWNTIRNIAAKPINFVIDTVYNNGLREALNKVRGVVGGDPLPKLDTIPAFAKGGQMGKGWKLVGEEGPELINTGPGFVHTAKETQSMLAVRTQAPEDSLSALSGSKPSQARLANGGVLSDAWGAIGAGIRKATDWARGALASAAGLILNPIKNGLGAILPDTGLGDIAKRSASSVIDGALSWIRGKDSEVPEGGGESGAVFNGPRGAFHRPSNGPFTSMFGPRWGAFHAGVDIAGGGKTFAALNGIVKYIGKGGGLPGRTGHGIRLDHGGGFQTYYGHNPYNGVRVKVGQQVKAGQHIGAQGNTGNVTGTHLHFETLVNGSPRNPMGFLHDQGGWHEPGTMSYNGLRTPEAILTPRHWDIAEQAIEQASSEGGGDTYNLQLPKSAEVEDFTAALRFEQRRKKRGGK